MNTELMVNREKLQEIAAWLIGGIVAFSGFRYLMRFVSFMLSQLYRILIQGGGLFDRPM